MAFKLKLPKINLLLIKNNKASLILNIMNLAVSLSTISYVYYSFSRIPQIIPLFYSMPWGDYQLAPKNSIQGVLIAGLILLITNIVISMRVQSAGNIQAGKFYSAGSFIINLVFNLYILRIVVLTSHSELILPVWIRIIVFPVLLAFITTLAAVPLVIKIAKKYGFMDDPLIHKHPAMLLTKPVPRAGGLAYFLGILVPALFILPILSSQRIIGILIGAAICVVVGLRDDKRDMSPYTRLFLQILAVFITVMSGIILVYIPTPFGEAIKLDGLKYVIDFMGEHKVYYLGVLAAVMWMWWSMNFMSFANGTDGVYAGLVSAASIVIAVLMLGSLETDPQAAVFIKLATLSAGAGLGMAVFTWPPQKLLWGFGATSAGLIIAALSIVGSTKVATTLLVLMIPFLDGMFAIIRRIRRGQMPFWGDREHLHHLLLEKFGWSKTRVAVFYWITAFLLVFVGISTQGRVRALSVATIAALVVLGISMANIFKKARAPGQ